MPEQDLPVPASGFAASTLVCTEWGPCRLADLAIFTRRREMKARDHERADEMRLLSHQTRKHRLARAHQEMLAAAKNVDPAALNAAYEQAQADLDAQFAAEQAEAEALAADEIERVLPRCNVNGGTARIASVAQVDDSRTDFVDVVIDVREVSNGENPPTEHQVKIRCTPDVLFVTPDGDVAAADLAGKSINRTLPGGEADTFGVPEVLPVALPEAAPVFSLTVEDTSTAHVGSDDTVAAIVRL